MAVMRESRIPVSTYRLQFSRELRFNDAKALVPYLHELGITDLYASPLLQARRGSSHGYDVADPSHLNSELGTDEEFDALVAELQSHGMGLILDIVPNHMAASSENPWWMDVLEDGPRSSFASHFDVDWHPPSRALENRVLLPILGKSYAQVLEGRELRLTYTREGFFLHYFDFTFPIATRSYNRLLGYRQDRLERIAGPDAPTWREFEGIQAAIRQTPPPGGAPTEAAGERRQHREAVKERLWQLYTTSAEVRRFVDGNVRLFNGRKGVPASFLMLDQLLSDQAYVLAFWQTANQEINYRRFFTISDLVGLRVEDPMTFEAVHAIALRLASKGMVNGLRVDHIDGLRDPLGYLRRLQERAHPEPGSRSRDLYLVVEKILSDGENLPTEWPVHGTTGYDFLNAVNGLFVDAKNLAELEDIYAEFINERINFSDLAYKKKKQVMDSILAVEMRSLGRYLGILAAQDRYAREISRHELTRALVEVTACLQHYRTYIRGFELKTQDKTPIEKALREAQQRNAKMQPACFTFLREVLLLLPGPHLLPEQRESRLAFVMAWQQFTGPITAKGVEDSALYVYNRLVSLNEVGSSPQTTDLSLQGFHAFAQRHHHKWPFGMNATMTHDAKRAEGVRTRISVLSEIPGEWRHYLNKWSQWNESQCREVHGVRVPERNEETLLYQTLIGSWPVGEPACACYTRRIQEFMVKAVREAMVHTRWTLPNLDHERALEEFIENILRDTPENRFLRDLRRFADRVAYYGALNNLSQLVVKLASPGVADFYQGSELWDLRLVDPDNRKPVDFTTLRKMLASQTKKEQSLAELLRCWRTGQIKLHMTQRGLRFRQENGALLLKGAYLPLEVTGTHRECVIAFGRTYRGDWAVAIAPRFTVRLGDQASGGLGTRGWNDTGVLFPKEAPRNWINTLNGEEISVEETGEIRLNKLLENLPVALLSNSRD
jgi:(1->4)-alpha-D-glucan 1-alpha-D-glucosylmutase